MMSIYKIFPFFLAIVVLIFSITFVNAQLSFGGRVVSVTPCVEAPAFYRVVVAGFNPGIISIPVTPTPGVIQRSPVPLTPASIGSRILGKAALVPTSCGLPVILYGVSLPGF